MNKVNNKHQMPLKKGDLSFLGPRPLGCNDFVSLSQMHLEGKQVEV